MRHPRCRRALSLALTAALLSPLAASGADRERVGKKDLKAARGAVEEGRWSEGLEIYEKILESPLVANPDTAREALYSAALLVIVSPEEVAAVEAAAYLERLTKLRPAENVLEITALTSLLEALDTARQRARELSEEIVAMRDAFELERQSLAAAVEEERAAVAESVAKQKRRNRELRRSNRTLTSTRDVLAQRLEDVATELAEREADLDFLVGQLEGTQEDQQRMLQSVMTKNEELQKRERQLRGMRIALNEREAALAAQAEELSEQAEELGKREAAIREVTERVLKDDGSDR